MRFNQAGRLWMLAAGLAGAAWGVGCDRGLSPELPAEARPELGPPDVVVRVETDRVGRRIPDGIFGINLNYLLDGAGGGGADGLTRSLQEMGVGILRYPGGEKSDATYFAHPPEFTRMGPVLIAASEWPRLDPRIYRADSETFVQAPLNFDAFRKVCGALEARALLVLPYDIRFAPKGRPAPAPSLPEVLDHAAAWARHARKRGFEVMAWEVGNESYLSASYNGQARAVDYAEDVIRFAEVIRREDPGAKIAVCGPQMGTDAGDRDRRLGSSEPWWKVVLSRAGAHIDYLSIHTYPVYGWGRFEAYGERATTLGRELQSLEEALKQWAAPEDAARIRFLITETNSADWEGHPDNTGWSHLSSFGHALVLFDILAEAAVHPRIDGVLVWNTRWLENQTAPQLWDAIDGEGRLLPTGEALKLAARFVRGQVVGATASTEGVRVWAMVENGTGRAVLINRTGQEKEIELDGVGECLRQVALWQPGPGGPGGPGELTVETKEKPGGRLRLPGWSLTVWEWTL